MVSINDLIGALLTLFLAIKFILALIHAYKKYIKKQESEKFSNADFSFIMVGSGFIVVMLIALYMKYFQNEI